MDKEIKKGKDVSLRLWNSMDKERSSQYGKDVNLFDRKHHRNSNFFFVKDGRKVVAFGFLRPVKMTFRKKVYDIFALGGIMVFQSEKGKGYGTVLMKDMIDFSKETGKSILGFCSKGTSRFYRKAGLKVKSDFSLRIEMENPKTKKRIPDPDGACPGIYFEGKDKFISEVSKGKGIATYWISDIKNPHF